MEVHFVDKHKFEAVLFLLVPQIIHLITENGMEELHASKAFYESNVYALLEQENTKLWHYSALTLYHMFLEEQKSGQIHFPEEAS